MEARIGEDCELTGIHSQCPEISRSSPCNPPMERGNHHYWMYLAQRGRRTRISYELVQAECVNCITLGLDLRSADYTVDSKL